MYLWNVQKAAGRCFAAGFLLLPQCGLFAQATKDIKNIDIIVKKTPTGQNGIWTCWSEAENRSCSDAEFQDLQRRYRATHLGAAGPLAKGGAALTSFSMGPNGAIVCGQNETRACGDADIQGLANFSTVRPVAPGRVAPPAAGGPSRSPVRAAPMPGSAPQAAVGIKNVGIGLGKPPNQFSLEVTRAGDGSVTGRLPQAAPSGSRITLRDAANRVVATAAVAPDGSARLPGLVFDQAQSVCLESPGKEPACGDPEPARTQPITKSVSNIRHNVTDEK
jgi:hypothetical protein